MPTLDAVEARVLGTLIEKARTTPDYYPMRASALVAACNQKSNRDPVTDYDQATVEAATERLSGLDLVFRVYQHDVRGVRYRHSAATALDVDPAEEALLCVLLLRGPQTVGELRSRTERLFAFPSIAEVERVLGEMARRDSPLVIAMPRQPGQKEPRWRHALGGGEDAVAPAIERAPASAPVTSPDENAERIASLERAMDAAREEIAELRAVIAELRASLGD